MIPHSTYSTNGHSDLGYFLARAFFHKIRFARFGILKDAIYRKVMLYVLAWILKRCGSRVKSNGFRRALTLPLYLKTAGMETCRFLEKLNMLIYSCSLKDNLRTEIMGFPFCSSIRKNGLADLLWHQIWLFPMLLIGSQVAKGRRHSLSSIGFLQRHLAMAWRHSQWYNE